MNTMKPLRPQLGIERGRLLNMVQAQQTMFVQQNCLHLPSMDALQLHYSTISAVMLQLADMHDH